MIKRNVFHIYLSDRFKTYHKPDDIIKKGRGVMSSREFAKNLIDQIPESKMYYIIA